MTDDLIARLRDHFADCPERGGEKSFTRPLLKEAADALEALRKHAEAMRKAAAAMAIAGGNLNISTDGMEGLRHTRQAVLDEANNVLAVTRAYRTAFPEYRHD